MRRLEIAAAAATNTAGIVVAYQLTVESKYTQSSYQQQLTSASTTGTFTTQLKKFSSYYSTPGFQNATSLGVVVATSAPSAAPSTAILNPVQQPTTSSPGSNNLGIYIGVGAAVVFFLVILILGIYYLVKKRRSATVIDIDNTAPTSITDVAVAYDPSRRELLLV